MDDEVCGVGVDGECVGVGDGEFPYENVAFGPVGDGGYVWRVLGGLEGVAVELFCWLPAVVGGPEEVVVGC